METHYAILLIFGLLVMLVAWLPNVLGRVALSTPIFCVAIGLLLFGLSPTSIDLDALRNNKIYEQLTEVVILAALMGAGLKIDRPVGWRRWNSAWRLIGIGMPLMMVATAAIGYWWLGFALPAAIFLAGALTPTDPVLASDVSVGPPGSGEEGEVRFALTAEAGLNDGLAFPVVALAMALSAGVTVDGGWMAENFIGRVALAVVAGWGVGYGLGWLIFRSPHPRYTDASAGLVAIGVTAIGFAVAEIINGYGFIAVFLSALALRAICPHASFHRAMAEFAEQIERLLVLVILVLFGGAVAGGLLDELTWKGLAAVLVLLFVVRPLTVGIALLGYRVPAVARGTIAFFGIRGIGALYYLVYATTHAGLDHEADLHALVGTAVLVSVLVHGLTSTPLMRRIDEMRNRNAARA